MITHSSQVTDPEGVRFMTDFPDVENNPGVEVWKDDESWSRERVQTGVFKTCRTMRYSEEQRCVWVPCNWGL